MRNDSVGFANSFGLIGAEQARVVTATPDGGLFIGGRANSLRGDYDLYLIRLKNDSKVMWAKTLGGGNFDELTDAVVSKNGDIYVIGSISRSATDINAFIGKLSPQGNLIWTYEMEGISNTSGVALAMSNEGSLIGAVFEKTNSEDDGRAVMIKVSDEGNLIWQKTIISLTPAEPKDILISPNDDIYIGGQTIQNTPYSSYSDALLIKANSLGDTVWTKRYHSLTDPATGLIPNRDIIRALVFENSGHIVIAASSLLSFPHYGHTDFWFVRVDTDGNIKLQTKYREQFRDDVFPILLPHALSRLGNGDYVISGRFYDRFVGPRYQMWVARFTSQGNMIWSKSFGDVLDDEGLGVEVIGNSIYSTGYTMTDSLSTDIYLLRLDLNGEIR
ncbi:MAG TPA: hypothetical protein PLH27_14445 [bacterium]|nr:hypothetical protein [bacterium]HNB10315.1 hypothetical protein [bacterium]HNC50187.1 hypothetical protein [bacterium]HND78564.1 hypothetical protein [bacterium]HNE84376.1 hypothetical protein [bacterium]